MVVRSSKRTVAFLRRFRRRRLLAVLRHDNLPATFDALKRETCVFFDMRFLQRLVVGGRWQEARGYMTSFLPSQEHRMSDEADHALECLTRLNVLDDLNQGRLGGEDGINNLKKQIEAIPSTMADPHYTKALRTVFGLYEHPANWRLKASQIVKDFILQAPEFRHLLRLPRHPINPNYTIPTVPFVFGFRRRHQRKNIGRVPASLLVRRFLPKERHPPPSGTQGSSSEPMDFEELFDDLVAGDFEVREQSNFSGEGIPGAPVVSCVGENFVKSFGNAATKRLNQEDSCAESAGAKYPRTTGEFCPDVVEAPSGGMDPMHVINKVNDLQVISSGVIGLLFNILPHGPDRSECLGKLLELEELFHQLRADSVEAIIKDGRASSS
ncbi:hypothetical protein BS78_03G005700 [Paspalum vaginatum]|nr:hypothetical protein BS78_03G005700 [Paspalum vaginatum]